MSPAYFWLLHSVTGCSPQEDGAVLGGAVRRGDRAALFLKLMSGDVAAGGTYPIITPGAGWKSLVMEIALTAILVSIILKHRDRHRYIGPKMPPSRSASPSRCWGCSPAQSAAR
jgi:hypothetical protein